MTGTKELLTSMGVVVPRDDYQVDPDQRRLWLQALREFKHGLKVRLKLGVLDTYCQQVAQQRKGIHSWEQPDWDSDYWVDKLYDAVKHNRHPPDLLLGFAQTIGRSYYTQKNPRPVDFLSAVDRVLKQKSTRLRVKFGVLK